MHTKKDFWDLSASQNRLAIFLACLVGLACCAGMNLFGIFVWDKALIHRSHTRARAESAHIVSLGRIYSAKSNNPFEAYRVDTLLYADWQDRPVTLNVKLPVTTQQNEEVYVCVSRNDNTFIPGTYDTMVANNSSQNGLSNPCRPGQTAVFAGSAAISVVAGAVGGVLSYWVICFLIVVLAAIARALGIAWFTRQLRAWKIRRRVSRRRIMWYRLRHGYRPSYHLISATRALAKLVATRPSPEVETEIKRTQGLIKELEEEPGRTRRNARLMDISQRIDDIIRERAESQELTASSKGASVTEMDAIDL